MLSAYQPTGSILQFIVVRVTFVVTDQRGRGALAPSIIPPVLYRPLQCSGTAVPPAYCPFDFWGQLPYFEFSFLDSRLVTSSF